MSLTARDRAPARTAATPLPLVVSGAAAGIAAAALSFLALAVVALGAWMLDPSGTQEWSQMLEAAAGAWLAGLGLSPTVAGVSITLLPLGFGALAIIGLLGGGRWAADASAVARRGEAFAVAAAAGVGFGAAAAVVAVLARTLQVPPTQAAVVCGLIGFAVTAIAVMHRSAVLPWRRAPRQLRDAAAAAGVAIAVIVGVSSAFLALAVITNLQSVNQLLVQLDPGIAGAILLAVLTMGYLPTAIVWTMAYVIGPGITIAVGSAVSVFDEPSSVALPGFPLFAALPGQAPAAGAALPASIVVAGVLAGLLLRRRGRVGATGMAVAAMGAGISGAMIALMCLLATGSLGSTSLQGLGPAPLHVGLIGAALIAVGALAVVPWPGRSRDV